MMKTVVLMSIITGVAVSLMPQLHEIEEQSHCGWKKSEGVRR